MDYNSRLYVYLISGLCGCMEINGLAKIIKEIFSLIEIAHEKEAISTEGSFS